MTYPDNPLRILIGVRPAMGNEVDSLTRLSALEAAVQMAELFPNTKITSLSMDEPGGKDLLRTCLALAADHAYLVQGTLTSTFDIAAAGCLMAGAVLELEKTVGPFDAIFCGGSEVGQDGLGPALSGWLDRPLITDALRIELDNQGFRVWKSIDKEFACLHIETPCVVSFLRSKSPDRYPELPRLMAANRVEIPVIKMHNEPFLQEIRSFQPQPRTKQVLDANDAHMMETLVELLRRQHII